MSLILDALRKSEAERRRGESPSLYSGLPTPGTRQRPAWLRVLPWLLVALLVFAALFAILRNDEEPATKADLGRAAVDSPVAEDAAAGTIRQAEISAAVEVPAAASPPVAEPPAADAAPMPTVDALVKAPSASVAAPAVAPPTPVPAPASAEIEPAPPAEEALPPLAVLEPSARTGLPPLKLSMHVYNSEPTRRFAIIDGQRVIEGAQLGAAVVTEIRRDGVVLDVGGRRVLVPRP